jgi:BirA family biotin operon repressor/biotin-[acetyl-CoA-carboxylase] ligase
MFKTLDREQLNTELAKWVDPQWQKSLSVLVFDRIPSTNQIVWESLEQGHLGFLVAIASEQTAGRGQWGRSWQSEQGGLYLSLGLPMEMAVEQGPHITLWSAWGIAESLRQQGIAVYLKWPNDLILEKKKLGGIKTETKVYQEKIIQSVIGVGINGSNSVPSTGINLETVLNQKKNASIHSLETLAAITLQGLFLGYQGYKKEGIDSILSAYLDYFFNLGQSVLIENCPGMITGITAQGELKVRLKSPGATTEITLPLGSIQLGYE